MTKRIRTKKVVDARFAKSAEYQKVIRQIANEGRCPFCQDNFKYHKYPILKKRRGWFVTRSSWPYPKTKLHFIILGKKHLEHLSEFSVGDWENVLWLIKWTIRKFKISGGGLAMRFGETSYTGASVCHLHAHLIVPKLNKNGLAETVKFPIG